MFNFGRQTIKYFLLWQEYHHFTVKNKVYITTIVVVLKVTTLNVKTKYQEPEGNHFVVIVVG